MLDVDLCGPSIPRMLNVEGQDVHQCPTGCVEYVCTCVEWYGVTMRRL